MSFFSDQRNIRRIRQLIGDYRVEGPDSDIDDLNLSGLNSAPVHVGPRAASSAARFLAERQSQCKSESWSESSQSQLETEPKQESEREAESELNLEWQRELDNDLGQQLHRGLGNALDRDDGSEESDHDLKMWSDHEWEPELEKDGITERLGEREHGQAQKQKNIKYEKQDEKHADNGKEGAEAKLTKREQEQLTIRPPSVSDLYGAMEQFQRSQDEENCMLNERKRPDHKITYRQIVDVSDVYLQLGNRGTGSASCEEMILTVDMPEETAGVDQMIVTVNETHVKLRTPVYHLYVSLPHRIDVDSKSATYNIIDRRFTVVMRIHREFDFVNF